MGMLQQGETNGWSSGQEKKNEINISLLDGQEVEYYVSVELVIFVSPLYRSSVYIETLTLA